MFFGEEKYVSKFDGNNFSVCDMDRKKYAERTSCLKNCCFCRKKIMSRQLFAKKKFHKKREFFPHDFEPGPLTTVCNPGRSFAVHVLIFSSTYIVYTWYMCLLIWKSRSNYFHLLISPNFWGRENIIPQNVEDIFTHDFFSSSDNKWLYQLNSINNRNCLYLRSNNYFFVGGILNPPKRVRVFHQKRYFLLKIEDNYKAM